MLFQAYYVITLGPHLKFPKCGGFFRLHCKIFISAGMCDCVWAGGRNPRCFFLEILLDVHSECRVLLPCPSWEAFSFSIMGSLLLPPSQRLPRGDFVPRYLSLFPRAHDGQIKGDSLFATQLPLPQPHHCFCDVQMSGVVTNNPFHAPLVPRAEAES